MVEPAPVFKSELHEDVLIIVPLGHSLQFAAGAVEAQTKNILAAMDEHGTKNVVVDLERITLIDSIVIGSIITFARTALQRGGKAVVCNVSDRAQEMLQSVRLDRLTECSATREEALAMVKQ